MEPRPFYHRFAWAYDFLQTEDVVARVDFMESVLAESGIHGSARVVDAGCGTGRYSAELARRGFNVLGIDQSIDLIAVAKQRVQPGRTLGFAVCDICATAFAHPIDFVLCRGVLNDLLDDARRAAIFHQFSAWLRPGGVLMFDARLWANTVERYSRNFAHQKIVDVANGQLTFRSATTLDHETRSMIVHEWFDLTGETQESVENVFVMRPWTPAELTASMDRNGIRQLRSARGYCAADNWTDRMVVIASNL